jgi:nucleotide-binding universal stress UspA family protein
MPASHSEAQRAEVIVVVAYDPPVVGRRLAGRTLDQAQSALSSEAETLATEAVAALHARGARAGAVVVEGRIAEALLDTARREEAGLIVVGRSGLSSEVRSTRSAGRVRASVAEASPCTPTFPCSSSGDATRATGIRSAAGPC